VAFVALRWLQTENDLKDKIQSVLVVIVVLDLRENEWHDDKTGLSQDCGDVIWSSRR
jgi:hypothetical protein